jgi:hypothetical protein
MIRAVNGTARSESSLRSRYGILVFQMLRGERHLQPEDSISNAWQAWTAALDQQLLQACGSLTPEHL